MSEEKKKTPVEIPIRINTDEILDPQARWICQRLDKLALPLMELLTETRKTNSLLEDIKSALLQEPRRKNSDYE